MHDAAAYFADLLVLAVGTVPLFFLVRRAAWRRALLTLVGVWLLFVIAPRLAIFYLGYWLLVAGVQALVGTTKGWLRNLVFLVSLVVFVSPMVLWKLFPEAFTVDFNLWLHHFTWNLSPQLGAIDAVKGMVIPIGLSFSTFRALDLLITARLGLYERLSFGRVLFYGLFPPIMVIGPIAQYEELEKDDSLARLRFRTADLGLGLGRIAIGLVKVFVLALPLKSTEQIILNFPAYPPATLWVALFLFAWYFYLNFSGFSDMAIGAARLLGIQLKENFSYPYFQPNLQRFWSSWHMSLTRFAQRNIYVPAGGYRTRTQYLALVATMMVIALWHDLSLPLLIFGLYHSAGLLVTRIYVGRRKRKPAPAASLSGRLRLGLSVCATFGFVMMSFPLVLLPLGQIVRYYAKLAFWH